MVGFQGFGQEGSLVKVANSATEKSFHTISEDSQTQPLPTMVGCQSVSAVKTVTVGAERPHQNILKDSHSHKGISKGNLNLIIFIGREE